MKIKHFVFLVVMLFYVNYGVAQKKPQVQKNSIFVPRVVKIDGKADEWDSDFAAYNSNNSLYYSIANDEEHVYAIFKTSDLHSIEKILSGGITFSIKSKKKGDKTTPISITYPILTMSDRLAIYHEVTNPKFDLQNDLPNINSTLTADSKDIKVIGIPQLSDTLISKFNDQSIKAESQFNDKKELTYEFSLPLKIFKNFISHDTFDYEIILNGAKLSSYSVKVNGSKADPNSEQVAILLAKMNSGPGNSGFLYLTTPTDFSGEYTLAKKP